MFDSKRILDQLVSNGLVGGLAGGAAGAVAINALSGKKVKKYAGTALKAGGLAVIGGVAYKAWQHYREGQTGKPEKQSKAFLPDTRQASGALNLSLVRAMILAARADGNIDSAEHQAIMARIAELQLDDAEKSYLFDQFAAPPDINALAREARSEAHATEMYAASAMILMSPSPSEKRYLDRLAAALRLPPGLQEEIHRTLEAQETAA